jgi:hypothetical protein
MAATRHLTSFSEDGFLPPSISKVAWLFVLVSIALLAVAGEDFLVSITDFMVLISLGLIAFSAIWLKRRAKSSWTSNILPVIVGISCFVAAAAIYFIQSSVAVFGSLAIVLVYLVYDVFELGNIGVQLFLAMFDAVVFVALEVYPHVSFVRSFPLFSYLLPVSGNVDYLQLILLISSLLLLANLVIDYSLRQSASRHFARARKIRM